MQTMCPFQLGVANLHSDSRPSLSISNRESYLILRSQPQIKDCKQCAYVRPLVLYNLLKIAESAVPGDAKRRSLLGLR